MIYIKEGKKREGEAKTAMHVCAAEVLVDNLKVLDRAKDFAERVADKAVWSKVSFRHCSYLVVFSETRIFLPTGKTAVRQPYKGSCTCVYRFCGVGGVSIHGFVGALQLATKTRRF